MTVVSVHWLPQYMPASLPLFKGGYVGVDLFLVLSGFLITRILWRSRERSIPTTYGRFLVRRAKRLYPALLGMLVIVTALVFVTGNPTNGPTAAWRAAIAAVQLTPIVTALRLDNMLPFEHTWTLGWEWYFYILWPLVLLYLRNRGSSAKRIAVGSCIAAVVFWVVSLVFLGPDLIYNGPLNRFAQLLVGSAVGLAFIARDEPLRVPGRVRNTVMAVAVAAVLGWTLFGPKLTGPQYGIVGFPMITLSAAALIAFGYRAVDATAPRLLSWKPLERIGLWSYSIYLWHLAPTRLLAAHSFGLPRPVLGVIGVAFAVVTVALSYRFLERPFLRKPTVAPSDLAAP